MKILIYSLNFQPELTGVGKYSGELANWLSKKGHDVRVVTAMPYYPRWKIFEEYSGFYFLKENVGGVEIWRSFHYVPKSVTTLTRILHLMSFAITSIPNLFCQILWRPNLIFVVEPTFFCTPAALILAKISGSKTWLHIQDFEIDAAFGLKKTNSLRIKKVALSIEGWIINFFDRVSTISTKMLEVLRGKGIAESKTLMLPNWANWDMLGGSRQEIGYRNRVSIAYREAWGISSVDHVVMYSGNMGEKQGLELIVESARILKGHQGIKFVMCGDGVFRDRLMKMALDLQNIIWLPLQPADNFYDFLCATDIHLLPQLPGIADLVLPSKLIGMMASGRPVVASANKDTELDHILSGRGIVVGPENAMSFCNAIVTLIDDGNLRDRLGMAAKDYINQYLNQEQILSQFESEIDKLITM